MANIEISNLQPAGSVLFSDPESFLVDIEDEKITTVQGGITTITTSSGICIRIATVIVVNVIASAKKAY